MIDMIDMIGTIGVTGMVCTLLLAIILHYNHKKDTDIKYYSNMNDSLILVNEENRRMLDSYQYVINRDSNSTELHNKIIKVYISKIQN